MTTPVIMIGADALISEAADLMLGRRINCLPVIGDGNMVGIVSVGDILRRREPDARRGPSRWLGIITRTGSAAGADAYRVSQVMTTDVVTVRLGTDVARIVELMTRHNIRNVPIFDGSDVVGIITRSDLLRAQLRMLSKPDAAAATVA